MTKQNKQMTDSDKIRYVTESVNELVETLWNGEKDAFCEQIEDDIVDESEGNYAIFIGNKY